MGASMRHVRKYVARHHGLCHSSNVLVIETSLLSMAIRTPYQQQTLPEAVEGVINSSQGPIVMHIFSNGGAHVATGLVKSLAHTSARTRLCALILDSCPGIAGASQTARAITVNMTSQPLVECFSRLLMHLVASAYFSILKSLSIEDNITSARSLLNDTKWFSRCLPRLYLYSEKDIVAERQYVHEHAVDARSKGYGTVRETEFYRSPHCALMMEDPEKYWNTIARFLIDSMRMHKQKFAGRL